MVTLSNSTAKSTFHQLQTFNSENNHHHHHHLHDAIFSPYLNSKEGNFVEKLRESSQKINSRKSPLLHQMEKTEESEEIGVFGAEKYFHGVEVESPITASIAATKYLHQRDEQIETRKYQVQYGTPSILSESSSNSQSALLKSGMKNSLRNKKDKVQAKSVLASLGLKCSCSDKNSVDISEHSGEISFNKTTTHGVAHGKTTPNTNHSVKISKPSAELFINSDVHFQKQGKLGVGLNNEKKSLALGNHIVKMQLQLDEEAPRKSLEVFGSPLILNNKSKSLSTDKRLVFPSRNGAPKIEEIDSNYDDAASDASSDLFEIESFKGKGKSNTILARQASDAGSSCVSPICYAPSEASIEWSVVTASAAVMSDCEEQMSEITIRSPIRPQFNPSNGKPKATKETQRRGPSILLGCKSHKAVRVAGDAFITYEKSSLSPRISNRINTSQVARFPGETEQGNFGARLGQHAYATPPLQDSHSSPHASKLLYI